MVASESTRSETIRVSAVANIVRRRWRAVTACALLGIILGGLAALLAPTTYSAQAVVVVNPIASDPLSQSAPSSRDISTETEAEVVASSSVAQRARALLGDSAQIGDLLEDVRVSAPLNSQALQITYVASTPRRAADGANAFAEAYLSYRSDVATERNRSRASDLTRRADELDAQVSDAAEVVGSAESADARAEGEALRRSLLQEIAELRRQASALSTSSVSAGQLVDRAAVPASPSGPTLPMYLVSGLVVGLLAGLALALWRNSRDDGVADADDLENATGAPTLVTIPSPRRGSAGTTVALLDDASGESAEAYRVLAAKLEAPGVARAAASFLVVNVATTAKSAAPDVALALAELGHNVALAATPATMDALRQRGLHADRDSSRDTRAFALAGVARVSVVPLNGDGDAEGSPLMHPDAVMKLARHFDRVVVDGSTDHESTLLSLAIGVDAVVLAVTAEAATASSVRDLVAEFEQVGTPVIGSVLFAPGAGNDRRARGTRARRRETAAPVHDSSEQETREGTPSPAAW